MSKALNTLAKVGQQQVRSTLDPQHFTIAPSRRAFLERLVRINRGDWATKTKPWVTIGINQGETGTGKDRSQILGRHEAGGERDATDPMKPFFIPTEELRTGARDLPPRSMYPTALRVMEGRGIVSYTVVNGKRKGLHGTLRIQSRTTARGKVQIQGKRDTFVMGALGPQDLRNPKAWGIWRRTGPGKRDIEPIWWFRRSIHLTPRLQFGKTVAAVVDAQWQGAMVAALDDAMRTAR
ncbi:MAG: hypothetical protein ACTHU0_03115 [Kofleriaceae bacterium]